MRTSVKAVYKPKFLRITNYREASLWDKLLLVTLVTLALVLVADVALAQGPTPTDDEVNRIAKQLYCPVCESTPLDVCPTEACRQWRDLIRTMLAEGKNEAEIKQYFVAHYGDRVLAEPPNRLVTYLVPTVAILLGAFLLFRGFQMWMKPSKRETSAVRAEPRSDLDPYIARLEEELKKQK
jgi:cytochrome c-type biogenesis protein CcmH